MNGPTIAERDAAYGRHSNIPACCVNAFLKGERSTERGAGYVRCSDCIAKDARVTLHYCSPQCQEFLSRLGYSDSDIRAIFRFNAALEHPVTEPVA